MCCEACFIELAKNARQVLVIDGDSVVSKIEGITCPLCTGVSSATDLENCPRLEFYYQFNAFFVSKCANCKESFKNHTLASHLLSTSCLRFTCPYCDNRDCQHTHFGVCTRLRCSLCRVNRDFILPEIYDHLTAHQNLKANIQDIRTCITLLRQVVDGRCTDVDLIETVANQAIDISHNLKNSRKKRRLIHWKITRLVFLNLVFCIPNTIAF
jgi:hypothetical protein